MNLNAFFKAKSIAVIGASRDTRKVGHVIVRNLVDEGYKGKVYPVNPNAEDILGMKAYPSVTNIKDKVELWEVWENKDKWPWDADRISVKNWRKRAKEWRHG